MTARGRLDGGRSRGLARFAIAGLSTMALGAACFEPSSTVGDACTMDLDCWGAGERCVMGFCVGADGETGGTTGDGDGASGDGDGTAEDGTTGDGTTGDGDGDGTTGDGDGDETTGDGDGDGTTGDGDGTTGDGDGDGALYPCNVYVNSDPAILTRDGASWTTAYANLNDTYSTAIGTSPTERCAIWIAAGEYHAYVSGIDDTFRIRPYVDVYGGFFGDESSLDQRNRIANPVILDGRQLPFAGSPQARHVLTPEGDNVLDSLDVRWGRAALFASCSGATCDPGRGAGVLATGGDLTIRSSAFTDNAAWSGAAVYHGVGTLIVEGTVFDGNVADVGLGSLSTGEGVNGGVVDARGTALEFRRSILAVTTTLNGDSDASLALYSDTTDATIEDCVFTANRTEYGTVGLVANDAFGSASIVRTHFVGSSPVQYDNTRGLVLNYESAPLIPLTVSDSAFVRNGVVQGTSFGSVRTASSTANFQNTTFIDGGPLSVNSSGPISVINSIVRSNLSPLTVDPQVSVAYSIGDGLAFGTNLDVDPLFTSGWVWFSNVQLATYDPTSHRTRVDGSGAAWPPGMLAGRYIRFGSDDTIAHYVVADTGTSFELWGDVGAPLSDSISFADPSLQLGSQAIDSGDDGNASDTDIEGNPRVGVVDRGAFEHQL